MSNERTIPIAAFAVAATEAASLLLQPRFDATLFRYELLDELRTLFDGRFVSRPRIIAYLALREAFPEARAKEVYAGLGVADNRNFLSSCHAAPSKKWFDERHVSVVAAHCRRVRRAFGENTMLDETTWPPKTALPRSENDRRASKFTPRKKPRKLVNFPRAPRNITAALMGDPGVPSVRVARGEQSSGLGVIE